MTIKDKVLRRRRAQINTAVEEGAAKQAYDGDAARRWAARSSAAVAAVQAL